MRWAVFKNALRTTWISTLYWGIGLGAMGALIVLMVPALDSFKFVELVENMNPAMRAIAGIGEDASILASPEGLIATGFFAKLLLIFAVYPVVRGLSVTANEESDGIMNILLSLPLSRNRLMLEKVAAYALSVIALALMMMGGFWVGSLGASVSLDMGKLAVMTFSLIPLLLFVMSATVLAGAVFKERQQVITVITAFVITSFMIQTFGTMISADWMRIPAAFSFFTYYNAQEMLSQGFMAGHFVGLSVAAAALLAGAVRIWEQRDIAG